MAAAWLRLGQGWGLVLLPLAGVGVVLALEAFWLRPLQNARAVQIIAGQSPAPNPLHTLYIALEGAFGLGDPLMGLSFGVSSGSA